MASSKLAVVEITSSDCYCTIYVPPEKIICVTEMPVSDPVETHIYIKDIQQPFITNVPASEIVEAWGKAYALLTEANA